MKVAKRENGIRTSGRMTVTSFAAHCGGRSRRGARWLAFFASFWLVTRMTAATIEVRVQEGGGPHFDPLTADIHVGDTVNWVWEDDGYLHNVTSGNAAKGQSDGLFSSGNHSFPYTYSVTFQKVGRFPYYCQVHYQLKPPGSPNPEVNVTEATNPPGTLGNISTRLQVGTGNNVLFAGFIIQGSAPKKVLIRSAGPSLTGFGVAGALGNPLMELHDANNTIGRNDNWQTTQLGGVITADQAAEIQNSGFAPADPKESAIIATLSPGNYSAIVQGVSGAEGVATVELYDLSANNGSTLANISTRGFARTGDNVLIGGFILLGQPAKVLIRAAGPSLAQFGISNVLANPKLELHDSNGTLAGNDNWQTTQLGGVITSDQSAAIQSSGLAPRDSAEPAIIATLPAGGYSAIVQGVDSGTGIAVVEVYTIP